MSFCTRKSLKRKIKTLLLLPSDDYSDNFDDDFIEFSDNKPEAED